MKPFDAPVIASPLKVRRNVIEKGEIASLPAGRQGFTRNDNFLNRKLGVTIDPFGGAKPRLFRQGKEAPLRVNPCLPAGRLSLSVVLEALSLSKGKVQHLCWESKG